MLRAGIYRLTSPSHTYRYYINIMWEPHCTCLCSRQGRSPLWQGSWPRKLKLGADFQSEGPRVVDKHTLVQSRLEKWIVCMTVLTWLLKGLDTSHHWIFLQRGSMWAPCKLSNLDLSHISPHCWLPIPIQGYKKQISYIHVASSCHLWQRWSLEYGPDVCKWCL